MALACPVCELQVQVAAGAVACVVLSRPWCLSEGKHEQESPLTGSATASIVDTYKVDLTERAAALQLPRLGLGADGSPRSGLGLVRYQCCS